MIKALLGELLSKMNSFLIIAWLIFFTCSAFLYKVSGGDAKLVSFEVLPSFFFLGVPFFENPFFSFGGYLSLFFKSLSEILLSKLKLAMLESFFIFLTYSTTCSSSWIFSIWRVYSTDSEPSRYLRANLLASAANMGAWSHLVWFTDFWPSILLKFSYLVEPKLLILSLLAFLTFYPANIFF